MFRHLRVARVLRAAHYSTEDAMARLIKETQLAFQGASEIDNLTQKAEQIRESQRRLWQQLGAYDLGRPVSASASASKAPQVANPGTLYDAEPVAFADQLKYIDDVQNMKLHEARQGVRLFYQQKVAELRRELGMRANAASSAALQKLKELSQLINDVTGYSRVDEAKSEIERLEQRLATEQEQVKARKRAYTDSVNQRTETQKSINELLTRKSRWTPSDLEKFTQLYRQDHLNEASVRENESELNTAEQSLETVRTQLIQKINKAYNQENLWNVKMRGLSSWVTMGLMVLNIIILLLSQTLFEPLKIERAVKKYVELEHEREAASRSEIVQIEQLAAKLDKLAQTAEATAAGSALTPAVNSVLVSSQSKSESHSQFQDKFSWDAIVQQFKNVSAQDFEVSVPAALLYVSLGAVTTGLLSCVW